MTTFTINGEELPVEQFKEDWTSILAKRGLVVKLSIRRWRAKAKLTTQDLGLKFVDDSSAEFMRKYITLGKQKLLPTEVLNEIDTIERRSRENLSDYSFDTVWGKFVPFRAFSTWKQKNDEIRSDYIAAAKALGERYTEIVAFVKEDYKNLAKDVWARLYPESSGNPTASFIEDFVSKVIDKIPSQQEVVQSFSYDATYLFISMPSAMEEDIAEARQIRRKEDMEDFHAQLQRETKELIAEEYVERRKELMDDFLDSTVGSMRKYVSELCDSVLVSMGKRKNVDKMTSIHINKLNKMIEKVRLLNFYDDKEVDNLLNELELEIGKFGHERNDDVIAAKLKKIVETAEKEIELEDFCPALGYLEVD